jgi:hypothetical protein
MTTTKFWIFHRDGFVRLKLRPGQVIHYGYGGATDEGWSSHGERLEHAGDAILREIVDDGRDCDGRMTHHCSLRCPIDQLAAHDSGLPDQPGLLPAWDRISAGQRDEYAEAAGY